MVTGSYLRTKNRLLGSLALTIAEIPPERRPSGRVITRDAAAID